MNEIKLKANTICFSLADVTDAEFIYSLRINDLYNKYLSVVDEDVNRQREWLFSYKEREKQGCEYYFIIHRNLDMKPIGTVRLYDFIEDENSFSWGSWILNENKTRYAALESAMLIYDYAFLELGFKRCHIEVRKQNTGVIDFHKRFGVKFIDESEINVYGHFYVEDYLVVREEIKRFIEKSAE